MSFQDDLNDRTTEGPIVVTLDGAEARLLRELAGRLQLSPVSVVRLALVSSQATAETLDRR